jgi:hypothetical protein
MSPPQPPAPESPRRPEPLPRDDERERDRERLEEIERARELLERTVRFLTRCMADPDAARAEDDPRELIRGLRALAPGELPGEVAPEPRTIQIRHRRSA